MELSFVLYRDSDNDDLLNMILKLYQEDPEGEPINDSKVGKTVKEYKANPNKVSIYMLKSSGQNIGYAILVYFWSNEYGGNVVTVDELFVAQPYRRKGVSTDFLSFVEKMENIVGVQLEATPSNQRVLSYYQGLGFSPCQNTHLIKYPILGEI